MSRLLLAVVVALGTLSAAACHPAKSPKLEVIGVQEARRHEVVFVQVTNPASRPMRLTRLEYTFASEGTQVAQGEVPLYRELAAGAAMVVEVPLEAVATGPIKLRGTLVAELDQIVRFFNVSADVGPR